MLLISTNNEYCATLRSSGYESLQCHQMASENAWLYVCVCNLLRTPTYSTVPIPGANGY